jgi:putative ABC transport system permease protein
VRIAFPYGSRHPRIDNTPGRDNNESVLFFLSENFRMGLRNLFLHRLRSLLTALGIIFGVAAVIIMVSIGNGAKLQARKQMEQLGASNLLIRSERPPESNDATGTTQRVLQYGIKRVDVERLRTLPGIETIVPMRDAEQDVVRGAQRFNGARAIATTPEVFRVINLRLDRGQVFTQVQYERAEAVAVLGAKAAEQIFPFEDPIGRSITLGRPSTGTLTLTVIGVLEPTGLRAGAESAGIIQREIDLDVYFPLTLSQQVFGDSISRRLAGSFERKQIELSEVWIRVSNVESVEQTARLAESVVGLPGRADVTVKAPIEILRNAERLNRLFNFIMVGIASFSLVVGGIGIMNIMLATVTERTKEIGIRRALGAKQKHIILQFLIETTVISLAGGMIGIALGFGIGNYLPEFLKLVSRLMVATGFNAIEGIPQTSVAMWSVIASFVVSGLIGIGFGMYPALKAARMDPIEALRHE